ncbi:MAG: hypothetical protein AAGA56_31480, partial [Myxococcota bacterium]
RAEMGESFQRQDPDRDWQVVTEFDRPELGFAVFPWQRGLLVWRGLPPAISVTYGAVQKKLFSLQYIGEGKRAPTVPESQKQTLAEKGFQLETYNVLDDGTVVAIGPLRDRVGFGTILWSPPDWDRPRVFFTAPDQPASDLTILGGQSRRWLRLRVNNSIYRLNSTGDGWAGESVVTGEELPDVWIGWPMVRTTEKGTFARMRKDEGWLPLGDPPWEPFTRVAVDKEGVLWAVYQGSLYASRGPARSRPPMTEERLVAERKASILRGGEHDVLPEPGMMPRPCRQHYVRLLSMNSSALSPQDSFPALTAVLAGRAELAGSELIVTKEKDRAFVGLTVPGKSKAVLSQIEAWTKGVAPGAKTMCAEPPAHRKIPIPGVDRP